jgi:signal transduction histidine kinase
MLRTMADSGHSPAGPLRGRRADAVVAAVVTLVVALGTLPWTLGIGGSAEVGLHGWLLILAAGAVLYVRRSHPVLVAIATFGICALYYPLVDADGPIVLTFVVALFTVADEGHVAAAAVLGAATMAAVAAAEVRAEGSPVGEVGVFLLGGWLVAVIAIGALTRNRRAYRHEVQQREAETRRAHDEELRHRAAEERLRIARELHDALGHNISSINVQASAALHRIRRDPGQVEHALSTIKQTSKEALRELRSTLGVLRQVDEEAPTSPAPGLACLDELVGRARAGTLAVSTEVEGEPRPLPRGVDLAAYRIVQEALTNVARHADATSAVVRVRYAVDDLCIEIDDDGRAKHGRRPAPGHGIRGMQERAWALGGDLSAGPRPEAGFRVRARLPIGGSP